MKLASFVVAALCSAAMSGCVAPTGPVEVTRFHDATALQQAGRTSFATEAAPGSPAPPLEQRSYEAAVAQELVKLGYGEVAQGTGTLVAQVRVERATAQPMRRNPVSIGVGGSTGGYGSGVGMGIGVDLSGPPPREVTTTMQVMIRNRTTYAVLWEGRASFTVRADSPLAQSQLGAARMAQALFKDFPGVSGETIEVK